MNDLAAKDLAARVEAARQCWNAGDLAGYLTLYHPAIKLHGYGPEPLDKATAASFHEMMWAALGVENKPNPQLDIHDIMTEDVRYACRFTMTGMHRGTFMGVPATGRPIMLSGMTMMRFASDRKTVIERYSTADVLGLLVQIGAVQPPG